MKRKIIGMFVCMLLISTILPVAGNVSETKSVPPGRTWIHFYFGIINNLDFSDQGKCSFDHVLLFASCRIDGQLIDCHIVIGDTGFIYYDTVNGIVLSHFLCCKFTWVQY